MMLELGSISVKYGSIAALSGVSLQVSEGSLHGVIGPNGAGKSTLMDAITGRAKLAGGSVQFNGRDVTRYSVRHRRRMGMARSFQRTSIFPDFTIREQLELVARRCGGGDTKRVLELLGLTEIADARADLVAYGDQRRVDIGLALAGRASLLVLDEPAAGLSAAETTALFTHLTEAVRTANVTAVVVEHDVDAVFATCDEVTVLDMGCVLTSGPPARVRADDRVVRAYLGSAA
jgi:branched-chain amino acid transport system ATP-binding protein